MADEASIAVTEKTRAGRVLPLNSRRLTAVIVKRIAKALELPDSAALDDLRQMVDGKLSERGEEPKSVQVALIDTERGVVIELRNEDGVFLTVAPDPDPDAERAERNSTSPPRSTDGSESGARVDSRLAELEREVKRLTEENAALSEEVSELRDGMRVSKQKYRELWRLNCEQLSEYDSLVASKEEEIKALQGRMAELEAPKTGSVSSSLLHGVHLASDAIESRVTEPSHPASEPRPVSRQGKAPPIDPFDGETVGITFEDWLPTLQRAATWNGWTDDDCLVQLAGYLRKRALQEWNVLTGEEKKTILSATAALHDRLDTNNRVLAAQDFRHTIQRPTESVAEYIRRIEQTYRTAYGRDRMSSETRDTLLYSQLQEGLRYDLMQAPAVSGAQGYQQLCIAARNEERRLIELAKRRQYIERQPGASLPSTVASLAPQNTVSPSLLTQNQRPRSGPLSACAKSFTPNPQLGVLNVRCYNCNKLGHYARSCPSPKRESSGPSTRTSGGDATIRQVNTRPADSSKSEQPAAQDLLFSDSEGGEVHIVRVEDHGSKPRHAHVQVEGVPAEGVIDSGADITIIGGDLFRRVAAVARQKKKNFSQADKIPRTYDQ